MQRCSTTVGRKLSHCLRFISTRQFDKCIVQNKVENLVTRNAKISRLPVLPLEVQVVYWSSHFRWPTFLENSALREELSAYNLIAKQYWIAGQFSHTNAQLAMDKEGDGKAKIVFSDTSRKSPISVRLRHKKDPLNQQRIGCWYVEDTIQLTGNLENYIVM